MLVRNKGDYPTLSLSEAGKEFLRKRQTISLVRPAEEVKRRRYSQSADPVQFDEGLFEELRALRRRLAGERGVPPYVVFGDVSLRQMAAIYPRDEGEFSGIHGVGRLKLEEYGEQFLGLIREYVEANGITISRPPTRSGRGNGDRRPVPASRLSPTHEKTRQLVEEGLTLDEIAAKRGLVRSTIIGHIERISANGVFVDVSQMAPTGDRLMEIEKAFGENGDVLLSLVKERLGDSFEYDELRLARILLNQQVRSKE